MTTEPKPDTAALAAELIATFANNVHDLEKALEIAKIQLSPGYVFVWPQYWLGVAFTDNGLVRGTGVAGATITHGKDRRVITNGHGDKAILMPVREALEGALAHAVQIRDQFAVASTIKRG